MDNDKGKGRRSTRQLLEKIRNFPCLYRHTINQIYYGIKKVSGKNKDHSLDTTDRKIAERRLKDWTRILTKSIAKQLDRFLRETTSLAE